MRLRRCFAVADVLWLASSACGAVASSVQPSPCGQPALRAVFQTRVLLTPEGISHDSFTGA